MNRRRADPGRLASALAVAVIGLAVGLSVTAQQSAADVTAVRGRACGYFVNVGLFGGPQTLRGCGQPADAPAASASPSVSLPAVGSSSPITATDSDGAAGIYGPATIFGGIWPDKVLSAPPSGPISVSTQGALGTGGTVKTSTEITLLPNPTPVRCDGDASGTTNCRAPGGFGPPPVWGDSLHVECTASETAVSGLTRFSKAFLATATDAQGSPLASATEAIPDSPPPNYTRHGVITNVGDVFTAVFNEQVFNSDGSLTVNAVHMYLFGPTAVGEVVKGQATCGTTPGPATPKDTRAPTCGVKVVQPVAPDDPTPRSPRTELIGVFDAGGLQSISNVQVVNGTVQQGTPGGALYLRFTPGMNGPLAVTATRTADAERDNLPMTWSFDATDVAGNRGHCDGVGTAAVDPTDTSTTSTTLASGGGAGSTTSSTSSTLSTTSDSSTSSTSSSSSTSTSTSVGAGGAGGATTSTTRAGVGATTTLGGSLAHTGQDSRKEVLAAVFGVILGLALIAWHFHLPHTPGTVRRLE